MDEIIEIATKGLVKKSIHDMRGALELKRGEAAWASHIMLMRSTSDNAGRNGK